MSETAEPHPLDDLDDSPRRTFLPLPTNAYLPLLKPSGIVAMVCIVFIFMSGVATLIAAPNSILETVGSFMYRACTWVLLLACCGILLSFQIRHIRKFSLPRDRVRWSAPAGFWILTCANTLAVLVSYGVFWLVNHLSIGGPLLVFLGVIWIALSITLAGWSKSYLKGFFIGMSVALAIYFIVLNFDNSPILSLIVSHPLYSSYGNYMNYSSGGAMGLEPWIRYLFLALPSIAGLVCAYSVLVSEWIDESMEDRQRKQKSIAMKKDHS